MHLVSFPDCNQCDHKKGVITTEPVIQKKDEKSYMKSNGKLDQHVEVVIFGQ